MNDTLQWKVTSLRIPRNEIYQHCIDSLQQEGINLRDDKSHYTLANDPDYFIYEKACCQKKDKVTQIM